MPFSNQQLFIENIPTLDDVVLKPIQKSYLIIIYTNLLISYGALFIILTTASYFPFANTILEHYFTWIIIALIIVFLAHLVLKTIGFKSRKYALREQDIIYASGILIHNTTVLPHRKIQHIELHRSLLHRQLKLANLNVYSAGTSSSDLLIKGLHFEDAKKMQAFLNRKLNA